MIPSPPWLIPLGPTDIFVSRIAFGAGPVSNLLTDSADHPTELQFETIRRALHHGINWFDTAATYADGRSEKILGHVLSEISLQTPTNLATKARISPEETGHIRDSILRSVEGSLARLRTSSLALLQLHNSVTKKRGELPTSLCCDDILGPGGVLETFRELRDQKIIRAFGLTGIGDPDLLKQLLDLGDFISIQAPCHLLNPSTLRPIPPSLPDTDFGQTLQHASERGLATFAIRVLAGGALAGHPPSPHTHKTKFFSLDLYQRDSLRAAQLSASLPFKRPLNELALHYVLSSPAVTSAIIGFATPGQVDDAVRIAQTPPLSLHDIAQLENAVFASRP